MSKELNRSSSDASQEERRKYDAALSLDLSDEPNDPAPRPVRAPSATCSILRSDALSALVTLPDKAFRCCVTSPPYWGLRDYQIREHIQIGAETRLEDYITNLTGIFSEVHRVLADDGTLYVNIGDTYTSGG